MTRLKPFALSVAALGLSLLLLLAGFARPASAQSYDADSEGPAGEPKLTLNPGTLNFGPVVINTTSSSKVEEATNPSKKKSIKFKSITASGVFSVINHACVASKLGPGQTCDIDVMCAPTALGATTGTLTYTFTVSGSTTKQKVKATLTCTGGAAPTPTATATPTATSTPTATATATPTVTATPTSTGTGSGSATPTATASPGPQAGDVLIAGGDTGGLIEGFIQFSQGTLSTNAAEVYNAATDTFSAVSNLNTAREGAASVVLPNGKTLLVGGENCFATTLSGGTCGGSISGFECDALNTAELYTETGASTGTFALAGSGSSDAMTTARVGATATLLADGFSVLIVGGSSGSSFLGSSVPPAGCGPTGQLTQNTAEIYDMNTDTFTATASIPGCPAGTIPPTACTNNMGDALPAVCGTGATSQCGIVDAAATLLTTGGLDGLPPGAVLVTGGDYVEFFAQSSTQTFVYVPYYDSLGPNPPAGTPFWAPSNPMNTAREVPGIATLPSGDVLVAGGMTATAVNCTSTSSTPIEFTTNTSAEIWSPATFEWTAVTAQMSNKRVAPVEQFSSGTDAGMAIIAGGIDYEAGAGTTCVATTSIKQTSQTSTDLFVENVSTPASSTFTATGKLNADRGNYGAAILESGPHSGDLVVFGGFCAKGAIISTPIGTSNASSNCHAVDETDYYEFFDPAEGTWTAGTATEPATPAAGPASALLP